MMVQMSPVETLGLALGAGFFFPASISTATVADARASPALRSAPLRRDCRLLPHPWVLGMPSRSIFWKFSRTRFRTLTTVWDAIHTFIRTRRWRFSRLLPPGALHRNGAGRRVDRWRSRSYFAWHKSQCPRCRDASPEPFSNWAIKFWRRLLAVWLPGWLRFIPLQQPSSLPHSSRFLPSCSTIFSVSRVAPFGSSFPGLEQRFISPQEPGAGRGHPSNSMRLTSLLPEVRKSLPAEFASSDQGVQL